MKLTSYIAAACLTAAATFMASVPGAHAASGSDTHIKDVVWPYEGIMGTVDRQSAQRGFQVYKEVCASCHSLNRVSFRQLEDIGFAPEEVATIAAEYSIQDGPNDDGDMFDRPGRASDRFPAPFANEKAARASNNGAYPPSLDLIIKSRPNGGDYLYSLLTGYDTPPPGFHLSDGMNYNSAFEGHQIAMSAPLSDDQVEYMDGTQATVDQMARDVVVFLQWAAEPEMEARKHMGLRVLIFLSLLTILFYIAKKVVWRRVKG